MQQAPQTDTACLLCRCCISLHAWRLSPFFTFRFLLLKEARHYRLFIQSRETVRLSNFEHFFFQKSFFCLRSVLVEFAIFEVSKKSSKVWTFSILFKCERIQSEKKFQTKFHLKVQPTDRTSWTLSLTMCYNYYGDLAVARSLLKKQASSQPLNGSSEMRNRSQARRADRSNQQSSTKQILLDKEYSNLKHMLPSLNSRAKVSKVCINLVGPIAEVLLQ